MLFEIGAQAILDAYYREAVMSFIGSLERFYEHVATFLAVAEFDRTDDFARTIWAALAGRGLSADHLGQWAQSMTEMPAKPRLAVV